MNNIPTYRNICLKTVRLGRRLCLYVRINRLDRRYKGCSPRAGPHTYIHTYIHYSTSHDRRGHSSIYSTLLYDRANIASSLTTTYRQSPSINNIHVDDYSSVHVNYRTSKEDPNDQGDTMSYSGRTVHNSTNRRAHRVRCRGWKRRRRRRSHTGAAPDGLC